jgi:hypothetical protein
MTHWNEKYDDMSLVFAAVRADTETMNNRNDNTNPSGLGFEATTWREAMGPGYQAMAVTRSIEQAVSTSSSMPVHRSGGTRRWAGRPWVAIRSGLRQTAALRLRSRKPMHGVLAGMQPTPCESC